MMLPFVIRGQSHLLNSNWTLNGSTLSLKCFYSSGQISSFKIILGTHRTKTALGLSLAADTSTMLHSDDFKSHCGLQSSWFSSLQSEGRAWCCCNLSALASKIWHVNPRFNSSASNSPLLVVLFMSSLSSFPIWSQFGGQSLGSFGIPRTTPQHVTVKEPCSLTFFPLRDVIFPQLILFIWSAKSHPCFNPSLFRLP